VSGRPHTLQTAGIVRAEIDLTRLPWIRPLVMDYARSFAHVAELYAGDAADPDAWRDAIGRVQRAPRDRAAMAAVLDRQLASRQAPAESRGNAARLADQATVAVVTGQQAGVFGGPLYTLLKAVTAIQIARRISREHNVQAVPVFWVDAEDHDWDEVRTAHVLDAGFALRDITLEDLPGAGAQPVARLTLDDRISAAIDVLESHLAPSEFTAEMLAALRTCYRPGTGVATAFAAWLEYLLGRHGLVVFEASDAGAKPLVAAHFERELRNPCRTTRLATEAGERMSALGHGPQVKPSEDAVALFYLDASGRHPIRRAGKDYQVGETVRSAADLREEAAAHPERFSPNVLLRPLVQDSLFPTVCYVAGPSELAYQGQLKGIYQEFGVELPLLYSRATATLLDSGALRFLDRYAVPLEALHAQDESALNRLLESQLPPTVEPALEETDRLMAERAIRMKDVIVGIDPTLAGAVDTTLERMRDTLKTLHAKIIQASKRKDETLRRQFTRTRTLAFPAGHPQERHLNLVFFANRYGPALCDALIDGVPLETDRHYILTL
jgi:bacillithiol biosynthesis cysteine-adding enzyme BshC